MLKRSISSKLADWKSRSDHHPLILRGLRQVGKTTTARQFGKDNYRHVVYIDLRANTSIHSVFDGDFSVDDMVTGITAADPSAIFEPGSTLLILDEIQDCPNARSSLKYWDLDHRYDVIATGSFLGVKGFRKPYGRGIPVGFEEQLTMNALTFQEFIRNIGINDGVLKHVLQSLQDGSPVMKPVHDSLRKYYLQYLIVGGMPEAVNMFLKTHDINQVRAVQAGIIRSMKDDFGRYFDSKGAERVNEVLKLRAEACLDSLPAQLSKEYKKFQYSLVDVRGQSTDKADGLQYLCDLGLAVRAFNLKEISAPLEGNKLPGEFKVFLADTGLFMSMLEPGTAASILSGDLGPYKGAVAENMVASTFAAYDIPLYYYRGRTGSPELDFVFSRNGEPTILECKATNTRATSMKYVLAHPEKYGPHPAIKLADTNVGGGSGFVTWPLYALSFAASETQVSVSDFSDVDALNRLFPEN